MDKSTPNEQWRAALTDLEYRVLRKAGTERPWTGALLHEHRPGSYCCRGCGQELFRSDAKFDSQTGWPSFFEPADDGAVDLDRERSFFFPRTEVRCSRCGSHLGHVFDDAPATPTGLRYCMNSVALSFTPE
jgi:peptide-methionine (R)-S-oxide reductase